MIIPVGSCLLFDIDTDVQEIIRYNYIICILDDFVFEAGAQWLQDGLDEMVKKLSNGNKIELIRVAE